MNLPHYIFTFLCISRYVPTGCPQLLIKDTDRPIFRICENSCKEDVRTIICGSKTTSRLSVCTRTILFAGNSDYNEINNIQRALKTDGSNNCCDDFCTLNQLRNALCN